MSQEITAFIKNKEDEAKEIADQKAKDLIIDLKNEYPDIYEQSVNIYSPNYTGLLIKGDYANFSYIINYFYQYINY